MIYSNNIVLKFVLLVQILNHLFALSDAKTLKTRQNPIVMTVHAKAGNYSWADRDGKCGQVMDTSVKPRLVNGVEVGNQEIPWMVSMVVTWKPTPNQHLQKKAWCGGAIVSNYFILTSSGCIPRPLDEVYLIEFMVGAKYKYESYQKIYEIDPGGFFVYPYTYPYTDTPSGEPTLSLLRVKHPIPLVFYDNKYRINRVCLPVYNITNNKSEEALLTGFGHIDVNGLNESWQLRKAGYRIDSQEDCQKGPMKMNWHYICSSFSNNQTCYGDMGSPLVQFADDRAVLIGIAAKWQSMVGNSRCGAGETLFIRVSPFVDWIENIIKQDSGQDWAPPAIPPPPERPPPVTRPSVHSTTSPNKEEGEENKDDSQHSGVYHLLADKTISIIISMFLFINILI